MERVASNRQIYTLRPFLDYQKSRLIQTCKALQIPWLEDPTNSQNVTFRNEIRNTLMNNNLYDQVPREDILALISSKNSFFHMFQDSKAGCSIEQ